MRSLYASLVFFLMVILWVSCADPETERERVVLQKKAELKALSKITALPKTIKSPQDNPTTPEKVALGKLLFFDPILSGNNDVACATCHHPDNGYAEFLDISVGVNGHGLGSRRIFNAPNDIPFGRRNAHTILNTAFNGINAHNQYDPDTAPMFWDVRVQSLEKQALEPIKNFDEMRGHTHTEEEVLDQVIARLKDIPDYQHLFEAAFDAPEAINATNVGKAIAAFERTLVTNNSRFDQYMRGDRDAISLAEKDGFELFKKAGCAHCHSGPMFSDFKPHVLGVPENSKLSVPDRGFNEQFAFRTPTLRNLRFTAPYMHNGQLKSLQEVLEFYQDLSFGKSRNPGVPVEQFDTLVQEIELSVKDMAPIISFFNTLNDPDFDKEIPASVPSGLPVGGNIHDPE